MEEKREGTTASVLVVSFYIAAQMVSDIASLKIARLGSLPIDGGTFIFDTGRGCVS